MTLLDANGRCRLTDATVRARVLLTGDLWPCGRPGAALAGGQVADVFGRCLGLFAAADAVVVNLESPLCRGESPIAKCGPAFRSEPAVAGGLAEAGVTAACLANNHILDQGPDGLAETMAALDAAGVAHCGATMTLEQAARPLVLDLSSERLALVNVAEGEFSRSDGGPGAAPLDPLANAAAVAEAAESADWVVAVVHHGNEQVLFPSPRMRQRCRELIDAGAHAVVCHHPHVVQGIETYAGRPIVHSLGNFLFDWPEPEPETDASFVVELAFGDGGVPELAVVPVVKSPGGGVDRMGDTEAADFVALLNELSEPLADDAAMADLWRQQCVDLAEVRYGPRLRKAARIAEMTNDERRRTELWLSNILSCEAHHEALETIAALRVRGRLQSRPSVAGLLRERMDRLKAFSSAPRAEAR